MRPAVLRDYQAQGVRWLRYQLQTHRAVLLADDPGLGKTLEALTAAAQLGAERILIICPAGARRVWQQEIARWIPQWSARVCLIEPGARPVDVDRQITGPRPLVLIIAYDELSNLKSALSPLLQRAAWDLLILDEAHYLKNPSNRTRAIYGYAGSASGLQSRAAHIILLTGTPTPNHAGELWQHCRTFWPDLLARITGKALSEAEFEERFTRYRDTVYGRQITGSKNQALLRAALAPVVLRRRKEEVLPELPPLLLQDIPLDVSAELQSKLATALRPMTDGFRGLLTDDDLLQALRQPDAGIATARRELGELKVAPTLLWVQERLASTDKLLVFAWHHSVIDRLAAGLAGFDPVTVTGATSPRARAAAVERFQTAPGCRIFLGQILAAGTAVTLTAASEVAIVEPSWVPGENVQAICRAHRLGQRDSVLASFLYLRGTLDERIIKTFRRKAAEISELEGDSDYASSPEPQFRSDRNRPAEERSRPACRAGCR